MKNLIAIKQMFYAETSIMRDHWLNRNGRSVKIWSDERFYDYSENCPEIQDHLI